MKVYHTTNAYEKILSDGFKNGRGRYMTDKVFEGVWFADSPMGLGDFGLRSDDYVLYLEIPDEVFEKYEWIEEGKPYREALIPAKIVNKFGQPGIHARLEDFNE